MHVMRLPTFAVIVAAASLSLAACAAKPLVIKQCPAPVEEVVFDEGLETEVSEAEVAAAAPTEIAPCEAELSELEPLAEAPVAAVTAGAGKTMLEGVEEFEVDGVDVLVKKTPGKPVVSAALYIRGGVHNLTPTTVGIEELTLGVVASGGSESLARDEMFAKLNAMGSSIASGTGREYSSLNLGTLRKNWDVSFDLFADVAMHPAFPADELDRQRARSVEFLKGLHEDADRYVSVLGQEMLFDGHPYAQRHWGSVENMERFSVDDMKAHHAELMHRERLLFVVVGDVERADVEAKVKASFATLSDGSWSAPKAVGFKKCPSRLNTFAADNPTHYALAFFHAPRPGHADYYPLVVGLSVLRSRLFEKIRTKLDLSYAVYAGMSDLPANYGYLYATSSYPAHALNQIYDEVESMQDWLVNGTDLANEVEVFITDYYMDLETLGAQRSMLANAELTRGDWRRSAELIDELRKVTPADVRRVMQAYLKDFQVGYYGAPDLFPNDVATTNPGYGDRGLLEERGLPGPGH